MLLLDGVDGSQCLTPGEKSCLGVAHLCPRYGQPWQEVDGDEADRAGSTSTENQPFLAATVSGNKRRSMIEDPEEECRLNWKPCGDVAGLVSLYKCRLEMEVVECSRSTDLAVHFREVDSSGRGKYLDMLGGSPVASAGIS